MLTIRGIDHVVLRVRDIVRMRKFYCEVLGASHVAYRPEFGMSHLRAGAAMIDLLEVTDPIEGRNMDHLCLRIEPFDQQAIVAHLKKYGVAVGDIKNRFGAEGNGTSTESRRLEVPGGPVRPAHGSSRFLARMEPRCR
jgi:glyoxylase I family protein